EDVFFNYSLDGGLTWQATDYRVDTDAADQNDPNRPRLCCDAGTVYVLWYLDEPTSHIYLNRATP
ncbi:MAG: hypothetical protein OER88_04080, partial [Planctomycetota bacterium]|nr:hypothetical protein [Planctomycetota bacterium]